MRSAIFVVEDTRSHAILFDNLLRAQGYHVVLSDGGWEVVEAIRDVQPTLVLMDIRLPKVSGLHLVGALKSHPETREIPVIAVTAHAMEADRQRCLSAGFDEHIAKPIDIQTFVNLIDTTIQAFRR